jgi:hypothetical protein
VTILNEDLEWNTIAADHDVRDAFRGTPTKVLLPKGKYLCRFITPEVKDRVRGNNIFLSPWWSDWDTTWSMLNRFRSSRAPIREVIRGRMAVTRAMNFNLDSLVQIILTSPVYAWEGKVRYQEDKDLGVSYIGGGTQLYLPNLADKKQTRIKDSLDFSPYAYIHCFTWVDSLT